MLAPSRLCLRGKWTPEVHLKSPITARFIGGHPRIKAAYTHFTMQRGQSPLRLLPLDKPLPPVLYNRLDQLMLLETALAHRRTDNQVSVALSQMSLGLRNAEEFLEIHLVGKDARPSLHALWSHEEYGLRQHQHVLSTLTTQHLVPLCSLLSFDYERGKMDLAQTEQVFMEVLDSSVGHSPTVHRELFNQMIRTYALAEEYDKATSLIEEMQRRRIRRNFITYAPIYRLLRKQDDVDKYIAFSNLVRRTEGGIIPKIVFIDIPRVFFYPFWVVIRWNWIAITVVASALSVAFMSAFLHQNRLI